MSKWWVNFGRPGVPGEGLDGNFTNEGFKMSSLARRCTEMVSDERDEGEVYRMVRGDWSNLLSSFQRHSAMTALSFYNVILQFKPQRYMQAMPDGEGSENDHVFRLKNDDFSFEKWWHLCVKRWGGGPAGGGDESGTLRQVNWSIIEDSSIEKWRNWSIIDDSSMENDGFFYWKMMICGSDCEEGAGDKRKKKVKGGEKKKKKKKKKKGGIRFCVKNMMNIALKMMNFALKNEEFWKAATRRQRRRKVARRRSCEGAAMHAAIDGVAPTCFLNDLANRRMHCCRWRNNLPSLRGAPQGPPYSLQHSVYSSFFHQTRTDPKFRLYLSNSRGYITCCAWFDPWRRSPLSSLHAWRWERRSLQRSSFLNRNIFIFHWRIIIFLLKNHHCNVKLTDSNHTGCPRSLEHLHDPSFLIQNSSFLTQNSSFLMQS